MSRTLYDILEVSKTAPPEVIKSAYRSLVAIYHPDSGQSPDEDKFKRIVRAYEVLSDPGKRSEYDARILHGEEDKFLGFANDDESLAPKTVKRLDGTDTWCTIDEHIRRKGAELAGADLNGLKLRDLSLKKAQLKGADLSNADIKNVDLSESNLESVKCKNSIFENVDFTKAKMNHAYFEKCIFKKCKFSGIPWQKSPIKHASFVSTDISYHSFNNLSFYDVDFSNSVLENSSLGIQTDSSVSLHTDINKCNMHRANLRKVNFFSDIKNVNFTDSNMENIESSSVKYTQCNFKNANLANANLKASIIEKPLSFEGTVLFNADLMDSKITDVDFSTCNLINTRFHNAKLLNVKFPDNYILPSSSTVKNSPTSQHSSKPINKTRTQNDSKSPLIWPYILFIGAIFTIILWMAWIEEKGSSNEWYQISVRLKEQRNWTQMINHAEEWTKAKPDNADAWFYLGYALGEAENHQKAVNAYRNSLEIDSFSAASWNNLGVELVALGKVISAREAYLEALKIDPECELVQRNLEGLQ